MREYLKKFDDFHLGVELLAYGFEAKTIPHLVEIANPGVPLIRDPLPHWAIGSGTFMALGVLNARGAEEYSSVEELVYRLCAAKFASETAAGVGRPTEVAIWFGETGHPAFLMPSDIDELRRIWEKERRQPAPRKASSIIRERINYWLGR
jgi:20S proteasome alpha/beta subunit